jgi:hypothetical protein
MMCGSPLENSGIRTIRCLDNFDLSEANFNNTSPSSKFFPPGVPGITGDYEVCLMAMMVYIHLIK